MTGDGKEVAHAKESLGARETGSLEFPALPPAQIYTVKLTPDDALALDNVAYATAGAVKNVSILFISPTPDDANGLSSIPGVQLTARTPDAYTPSDLGNFDLAIFEYATPKEIAGVNSMLVMPPPGDPVFGLERNGDGRKFRSPDGVRPTRSPTRSTSGCSIFAAANISGRIRG